MMDKSELKRLAAEKAVEYVESGMVLGLGTGSTAVFMVRAIGQRLKDGRLQNIIAIPTSEATAREAEKWGIPLTTLDAHPVIDVTIDGADEISPDLCLIKGLGGALLREKITAVSSKKLIIISDDSKLVYNLGERTVVPVEVIPFARQPVRVYLESLGATVTERMDGDGSFRTDENNIILDCHFDSIDDPHALAHAMRQQPGVVEHGLFLDMATLAVIAAGDGLLILE